MSKQIRRNANSLYFTEKQRATYFPTSSYNLTGGIASAMSVGGFNAPSIQLEADDQTFTVEEDGIYSIQWTIAVNSVVTLSLSSYLEIDASPATSVGYSSATFTNNSIGYYAQNSNAVVYLTKGQVFSIKVVPSVTVPIRSALGTGDTTTESKVNIIKIF